MLKISFEQYRFLALERVSNTVKSALQALLDHPLVKERLPMAPASSRVRYHHAYEGGLLTHIYDVELHMHRQMMGYVKENCLPPGIDTDSIVLTALIHDLHKIGDVCGHPYYVKNILKSGKQSDAEPFAKGDFFNSTVSDILCIKAKLDVTYEGFLWACVGEGRALWDSDCSLALVKALAPSLFNLLTPNQIFAIRYHDGAYGPGRHDSNFAGKETPLQILLHAADMFSSRAERNNAANLD